MREESKWITINHIFEGMKSQPVVPLAEIAQLVELVEAEMAALPGEWHSFGHVTEVYYYAYFCAGANYSEAPVDVGGIWRYFGGQLEQAGHGEDAMAAYQRALQWNPVDVESMLALIECYKRTGDLELCRELTDESYDLCNTRALLARYYRNLGFYYVETYQPELAEALYLYSELYCPTEGAQSELKYLSAALERKTPHYTEEQLRKILADQEIPLEASDEMLELTVRAAEDCEEAERWEEARECYLMLYDLTGSPRILERLENF